MENIAGSILKRAREAKGYSLDSVHEATKIPLDVLRAIEEGYKVRKISPFYLRSFIKLYAQYVDVKVSDVVDELPKDKPPLKVQQPVTPEATPEWVKQLFSPERLKQLGIVIGIILALWIVMKVVGAVKKNFANRPQKIEKIVKERKSSALSKASNPSVVVPVHNKSIPASEKGVTLTVRCKKNSWLVVKIDGEVVFQSTFKSGAVETWKAKEKIEISGKNLNQLDFELGGKMVAPLGRGDYHAKAVIFTQEGLSVVK